MAQVRIDQRRAQDSVGARDVVYSHVRATGCFEVYAADVGGGQFGAAVDGVRMRCVICKVEMCELEALPADLARFEELCENVGNGNKAGAGEVVAAVAGRVVFGTTDEVNEAVLSVQAAARNANRHLVADRYEQRRQALQSSKPPPESLLFEAKGRRVGGQLQRGRAKPMKRDRWQPVVKALRKPSVRAKAVTFLQSARVDDVQVCADLHTAAPRPMTLPVRAGSYVYWWSPPTD